MSFKDKLRAKVLNNRARRTELVTIEDAEGGEPTVFAIIAPSLKARSRIYERAGAMNAAKPGKAKEGVDIAALQVATVIQCCYEPQSEDEAQQGLPPVRIFDDGDFEALMEQEAGGLIDKLAEVAMKMLNKETKEETKND
jgi:hypothetical protein